MTTSPASRGSVLMLTPDREIDRRITLEADALRDDGWEVMVVALPSERELPIDPAWIVRARPRVGEAQRERAVLGAYRALRGWIPMNGPLMRGLKAIVWGGLADPEWFYDRLFAAAIAGTRPTIVVAHDLPMLPLAHRHAVAAGAKLVYDSHELWCEKGFPERWKRGWRAVESRHIRHCDAIITINHSIAALLRERYGLTEVDVITNATTPLAGRPRDLRRACGIESNALVLLYQGGLTAGRQLEQVVTAMASVRHPRVHLVMLGSGALKSRLVRLASRGAARGRVHFLDPVPQAELLEWSASADGGIIPYGSDCLNNHLCTPNKLYEFIAAGTPILANDLPELRASVAAHGFGLIREMRDSNSVATAIDEFFADPSALARWRSSLTQRQGEFAWPIEAAKYQTIMRRVAALERPAARQAPAR